MTLLSAAGAERFALLLGLSLFFGFAFEQFYYGELPRHPGGVRTFPLLALSGGALFLLEPHYGIAFVAGLLVVGTWIFAYVFRESQREGDPGEGTFIVPICNVLAYVLGPVALTQSVWLSVGTAVAAVMLLGGKRTLHDWAHRVSDEEVITAAMFLILIGVVLPLLPGLPAIPGTTITPLGVWLAVIAVSTISYVSYLLQKYAFPRRGPIVGAILGGLYSSTATTVVLARRSREAGMPGEVEAGIIAATAVMYVRLLVICALFNGSLAGRLAVPLLVPAVVGFAVAWVRARTSQHAAESELPSNPLQLGTALIFAVLFVFVALATAFVQRSLGGGGLIGLAAIVGVTDIDPFVLGIAQGSAGSGAPATATLAIVVATCSNNVLKAIYTVTFSRCRESWIPAAVLLGLAAVGIAVAAIVVH